MGNEDFLSQSCGAHLKEEDVGYPLVPAVRLDAVLPLRVLPLVALAHAGLIQVLAADGAQVPGSVIYRVIISQCD